MAGNALAANVVWSFTTAAAPPPPSCPCSAWSASTTPTTPQDSDPNAVELGVKFTTSIDGFITGVRFYKGTGNTGTHVGNLWSAGGALLARATFTAETASGWQQVNFASPVPVTANTVYVASYYAPNGNYAADPNFFATSGVSNGPVNLLSNGAAGGNGVYSYSSTTTFPTSTFNATNYWVDVVFSDTGTTPPDTTPPTVSSVSPAAGATGVATSTAVSATFSEAMDAATIGASTFELRDAANVLVASNVSYDAPTLTARLTPTAVLAASQTYTATVRGGSTGVKDAAGNALAANQTWSFTTGGGTGGCSAPPNPIVAENCLAGQSGERVGHHRARRPEHPGLRDRHQREPRRPRSRSRSDTNATAYRFDIYRMGYYGGLGARKVATVTPSAALPQNQPTCLTDATHRSDRLRQLGRVGLAGRCPPTRSRASTSPSSCAPTPAARATSSSSCATTRARLRPAVPDLGHHLAGLQQLRRQQPVHRLAGRPRVQGQLQPAVHHPRRSTTGRTGSSTPSTRWCAGSRPTATTSPTSTGVDSRSRAARCSRNHKVFLSVGHDEYWSGGQRANVEAARDAGVHLAFFSGNEVFWKTRWEPSIDGSSTAVPHARLLQGDARQREDRSARRRGPAPGATRASARRPTAAGPRTR